MHCRNVVHGTGEEHRDCRVHGDRQWIQCQCDQETGEPSNAKRHGGQVGLVSWTATVTGTATISTAGSQFDTTLGVYQGTAVNALTAIASNDDENYAGGILTRQGRLRGGRGTTYRFPLMATAEPAAISP